MTRRGVALRLCWTRSTTFDLERVPNVLPPSPPCPRSVSSETMLRRKFGNTDLEVSAIALGCWIFGVDWWGHYTQDDANRICSFSLDQGVTFFDNGDAYGNGRAETLFGQWMKSANVDRSKIEIGGKFGYDFYS